MDTTPDDTTFFHQLRTGLKRVVNVIDVEWRVSMALVLIAGGIWLTATVAEEVIEGDTHTIDTQILLALREPGDHSDPIGPVWFEEIVRDLTALGGTALLTLTVSAVGGYLLLLKRYRKLAVLLTAVIGGFLISFFLKDIFDRPRPDLVANGTRIFSASFPSGHSLLAAATYLTLGGLVAQIHKRWRLRLYTILLALFIMVVVGFSRVYLGVHWPTDVLAGWTLGAIWALVCWLGAYWIRDSDEAETPRPLTEK